MWSFFYNYKHNTRGLLTFSKQHGSATACPLSWISVAGAGLASRMMTSLRAICELSTVISRAGVGVAGDRMCGNLRGGSPRMDLPVECGFAGKIHRRGFCGGKRENARHVRTRALPATIRAPPWIQSWIRI